MQGLEAIRQAGVRTPGIIDHFSTESISLLLLEFVASTKPELRSWQQLGKDLARLHQTSAKEFGFEEDNFIGSVPQSCRRQSDWVHFLWKERFQPLVRRCHEAHCLNMRQIALFETLQERLKTLFPSSPTPCLVHGDLWNGNVLFSHQGPILIDPAAHWSIPEMDLAMIQLFGGFHAAFFDAYFAHLPKEPGFEQRLQCLQIYYLLVHLLLFGSSYWPGIADRLDRLI